MVAKVWPALGEQKQFLMGSAVGNIRKVRQYLDVRVNGPGSCLDDVAGLEAPQGKLLRGNMHQNLTDAWGERR